MPTDVNITLDFNEKKNNKVAINGTDITNVVTGISLDIDANGQKEVSIRLNKLSALKVQGKINDELNNVLEQL